MTKKVVGEEVHEDTVTIHSRDEANAALVNCQRKSVRYADQAQKIAEEKRKVDAEISEWETVIAALPAVPEPESTPGLVAEG